MTGCYWSDIGTPLSYARTVIDELRKNGETLYLPPSSDWCKQVNLDGYVVIEEKEFDTHHERHVLEELYHPSGSMPIQYYCLITCSRTPLSKTASWVRGSESI